MKLTKQTLTTVIKEVIQEQMEEAGKKPSPDKLYRLRKARKDIAWQAVLDMAPLFADEVEVWMEKVPAGKSATVTTISPALKESTLAKAIEELRARGYEVHGKLVYPKPGYVTLVVSKNH